MEEYSFCPHCTLALPRNEENLLSCNKQVGGCGWIHYDNPSPVVAAVVPFPNRYILQQPRVMQNYSLQYEDYTETGILLVQRGVEPFKGQWCLPCGYVNKYECPNVTAIRETVEETGVIVALEKLIDVRNPIPGTLNNVVISYLARPVDGYVRSGDDALDARIFGLPEVPDICFSSHKLMVQRWYAGELGRITGRDLRM